MTREEAIQAIGNLLDMNIRYHCDTQWIDALRMAIEALKGGDAEMQTIAKTPDYMQQSPITGADLISRADAIEAIKEYIADNDMGDDGDIGMDAGLQLAVDVINALPSAEQVTSKLKKPCDSLLTDDLDECKEQKSKLDLINRADAIGCLPMSLCYDNEPCVDAIKSLPSADRPQDVNTLYAIPKANYVMPLTEDLAIEYLQEIGWLQNHDKEIGRPHGEWVNTNYRNYRNEIIFECSQCKAREIKRGNFCPNCGAVMSMRGEEE